MNEKDKEKRKKIEKLIGQKICYKKDSGEKISFELLSIAFSGNFAYIIKAKCIEGDGDIKKDKIYALKVQIKKETNLKNYLREKTILSNLYELYKEKKGCDYIMKYYGNFEITKNDEDYLILITEYCEGINLTNIIRQCNSLKKYLEIELVIKILKQILEALNFLHNECHIMHRDIKPDNIILGNDYNIKLLDFGISVYLEKELQKGETIELISRKTLTGCMAFVAPEILFSAPKYNLGQEDSVKTYDYRIDIFSLGFTIYNLMNPIGKYRNLPEKTLEDKRENAEIKNDFYPSWLIQYIKKLYINDMEKRPKTKEALEELNKYISQYNININKKIHITYLDKITTNFPVDVLIFLEPSEGRQIKLITSMKSLLQVFNKLDIIKKIKEQINSFKQSEKFKKTLLYYFFVVLDIVDKYEHNQISKDIYNKNIFSFINQTFRKNKANISGLIPCNLYFMLLTTFTQEIIENFPFIYNDAFDNLFKGNEYPFSNIDLDHRKQGEIKNYINNNYKEKNKGPFVDNFYFIILKYQKCDKCEHISIGTSAARFIPLNIQNSDEKICYLIDKYYTPILISKDKCIKCSSTNVDFIKKNILLNLPNYLVFELEDKNKVLFDDIIYVPTFDGMKIKYEFISCIYKIIDNNISKYNAVIKNNEKNIIETYSDDNITVRLNNINS